MITKERLEDLIKQGGNIYYVDTNMFNKNIKSVCALALDKRKHIVGYDRYDFSLPEQDNRVLREEVGQYCEDIAYLKDIYEDIDEAKFCAEFQKVAKTIYLDLPTWEWMQPQEDEQDVRYNFYNYKHEPMGIKVTAQKIALYKNYNHIDFHATVEVFDNTKENYTLACRKAKELFLGVKDE